MNSDCHRPLPAKTRHRARSISILHEDDAYIVFDKPAGLLVIPTPKNERHTLISIVNQERVRSGSPLRLYPCHRIDRETSGVIVFAKSKRAQKLMMDLFKRRVVTKQYIAFVHGKLRIKYGEFRFPIKDGYRKRLGNSRLAVQAITRYKVLKCAAQFCVVEVQPVTGRTNQIRIHFSLAGHPLVGDRKFAFAKDYAIKFKRTALHAASIAWEHPISHKKVLVRSELPMDMIKFLAQRG